MVPVAMLVGAKADPWGHKPLLMFALAITHQLEIDRAERKRS